MEGGLNNSVIYEEYSSPEPRSDEKNPHILLLTASDEDEMDGRIIAMSPRFGNNSFVLPDDSYEMDGNDVQYQYIDQDGNLHQIQDISKTNLKLAQLNDVKIGWTKPMVKCLINCYRELILEFRDPTIKQKEVWSKAANIMKERGYNLSWSHCDRKWRNLKHTFKKYYYGKKDKKTSWEFYEDLLILFAPDCRDEYKGKQRMSRIILPPASGEDPSTSTFTECSFPPPIEICPKKIKVEPATSAPSWFTNYMVAFEKRQQARIDEIRNYYEHSLEVERQKCNMLETLLNKIANKCDM